MRRCSGPGLALALFVALAIRLPVSAEEVLVFAAASLADALKEIGAAEQAAGRPTVAVNAAGSNVLARQLEAGAAADLFLSADETSMDRVEKLGLLAVGTRRDLLGNTLVLVRAEGQSEGVRALADLAAPSVRRVALGDPKAVPAGVYARRLLERRGLWTAVEPKVVPCENVRAALAAVAGGDVDAGIVYRSDALSGAARNKVVIAAEIPASETPEIRYPAALLAAAPHHAAAAALLARLRSPEASSAFRKHGFIAPP